LSQKTTESSGRERLSRIALDTYRDVTRAGRNGASTPEIEARFYAYSSLRSTVRLRDGRVFLRVSDLLADAPDDALGGLARILFAKLLGRRVRPEWNDAYRAHAAKTEVMAASEELRGQRGSKRMGASRGDVFDLEAIFDRLNERYFGGVVERPRLGWTLRDSWRTHGHYDPAHRAIALSRTLDSPTTPEYVVEFVLFHEMLHALMPSEVRDGRHRHHTPEFREAEARYPLMREATAWLESFSSENGTRRKKRRYRRRG
jgi:hypothetical protein